MVRNLRVYTGLLILLLTAALALVVSAGTTTSLRVKIYDSVVDEHNTTAYYNDGAEYCSGSTSLLQGSAITGDASSSSNAYNFTGSPWTPVSGLSSTLYVDKADCGNNCMRVQFNSNNKILSLDTRGTLGPREVTIDFSEPCGIAEGCAGPAGNPNVFGGSVTTPVLMNIYLNHPYTRMAVCSSTTCPEAESVYAKLWFTDPNDPSVTWRIDWQFLRVLRMSSDTWYFLADVCDGSQVAGLSKLVGNRTQPKTVFNGFYLIPFFYSARKN